MVSRAAAVPGRADAERAAAALADAGVTRVVLFGSVARGEPTARSDIDLVAIYDDLDYTQRWDRRWELVSAAAAASGFAVDVVVTDRPEWKVRTEGVCTSLESRAARQGVVLVDRPPGVVDWDKEMVMPLSDYQESLYRLDRARAALGALIQHLEPSRFELIQQQIGDEVGALGQYLVRLQRGCGEAHAVVEGSTKALIHLGAAPGVEAWGHDIAKLCDQLVEPHRSALPPLLEPHGAEAISRWHVQARYQAEGRGAAATPELLTELARTACTVASYTADQFDEALPTVVAIRAAIGYVRRFLDGYDLATGQPHHRQRRRSDPGLDL